MSPVGLQPGMPRSSPRRARPPARAAWRRSRSRRCADRAGIAAGTVYRYFPGKTDLVAALLEEIAAREIGALRGAADVAPGPLSALAAAVMTFAARALRNRRLVFAAIAEPVDAELDAARLSFRTALAAEFASRIAAAMSGRHLPQQDAALAAAAMVGLLVEGLIGPHRARCGRPRARGRAVAGTCRPARARCRGSARPRLGCADGVISDRVNLRSPIPVSATSTSGASSSPGCCDSRRRR